MGTISTSRSRGFLLHVSNEHGSGFDVKNTIAACFDLLESSPVDEGRLGGPADAPNGFGTASTLAIAVQRDASILGVDGAVVSEQKVASHKRTLALHALKWALFRMGSLMSAPVLAATEGSVAELALVFPLGREGGLPRGWW